MAAEEVFTGEKTVKNSEKQVLAPKLAVAAQNSNFLNSKFELRASFCITNLKYRIYEASAKYGRRGGFHRQENSKKQ